MGDGWKRIVARLNKPLFEGGLRRIFAVLDKPLFRGPPAPRMPATPLGQIRDGAIVRVVGRALADGEPWRTPLSATEAACWSWRVDEYSEESGTGGWSAIDDIDFGDVFWLEDERGQRVRVERQGDSVIKRDPVRLNGKPDADMRTHIDAFLDSYSIEAHDHFYGFDRNHSYSELVVPVGALVSVTGVAQLTPDVEGITADGYRGAPQGVTLRPSSSDPMLIEFEE